MPYRSADDGLQQNLILTALAPAELARLGVDLEPVTLQADQVLWEAGTPLHHVYFPTTAVVSQLFTSEDGIEIEVALGAYDGLVGVALVLGDAASAYRAVVCNAGRAYRLRAEVLRWELDRGGRLQRHCLRYAQSLMTRIAQTMVCGRIHSVDQQLCRWLLVNLDCMASARLARTQEQIADRLGVRRSGISEAAGRLQAAGLIRYSRGHLSVLDRAGLEACACSCYAVLKREQQRLLVPLPMVRARAVQRDRPNPETLRQRAEIHRRETCPAILKSSLESARVVHELEVYQIECAMQIEELRLAYDEADALQKRYADLYDFAPVGFFTLDPAGAILDINLAGAILLGIKRSQMSRRRFSGSVMPEQRPRFQNFLDDVLRTRSLQVCELTLAATAVRPEAIIRIEAVSDEDGRECRMVVMDLTKERRIEQALRITEHYQRALIDNFPFPVWLKDSNSRFLAVNSPLARNFGFASPADLVGKTDFDITSRELAEAYRADDQIVLRSGESKLVEESMESQGESRWFETYKSPIVIEGERIGTVGFARDITARHITQANLERSERQFRSFIERLPLSVVIIRDGLVKYVNAEATDMFGYPPDECLGRSFLCLIHEMDLPQMQNFYEQQMRGAGEPQGSDVRLVSKAGKIMDCRLYASMVDWAGQLAVMAVVEDVSDYKRMESELRSLASIDFLTGLANRRQFMTRLEEAHSRLQRDAEQGNSVLILDLDLFKSVNDRYGHATGDAVLQRVAAALRDGLRTEDVAARIGGEEFAILLPGTDLSMAAVLAERLRQSIGEASVDGVKGGISVTVSIGVAAMLGTDLCADQVLQRADEALYRAKAAGRNRTEFATESASLSRGCFSANLEPNSRHGGS